MGLSEELLGRVKRIKAGSKNENKPVNEGAMSDIVSNMKNVLGSSWEFKKSNAMYDGATTLTKKAKNDIFDICSVDSDKEIQISVTTEDYEHIDNTEIEVGKLPKSLQSPEAIANMCLTIYNHYVKTGKLN